jgi:hypothetical protein
MSPSCQLTRLSNADTLANLFFDTTQSTIVPSVVVTLVALGDFWWRYVAD